MNRLFTLLLFPYSIMAATITFSGNPNPLVISTATPGNQPDSVSDSTTTYSITISPGKTGTISASLSTSLPTDTTFTVNLAPPAGAQSLGTISLSPSSQMLITDIPAGTYSNLQVVYTFSGTVSAGVISSTPSMISFTADEN